MHAVRTEQEQLALADLRFHHRRRADRARADHARRVFGLAVGRGLLREARVGLVHGEPLDEVGVTAVPPARPELVGAAVAHIEDVGQAGRREPRRGEGGGAGLVGAPRNGLAHFPVGVCQPLDQLRRIGPGCPGRLRAVAEQNAAGDFAMRATADSIGHAAKAGPVCRRDMAATVFVARVRAAGDGGVGRAQPAAPGAMPPAPQPHAGHRRGHRVGAVDGGLGVHA